MLALPQCSLSGSDALRVNVYLCPGCRTPERTSKVGKCRFVEVMMSFRSRAMPFWSLTLHLYCGKIYSLSNTVFRTVLVYLF